MTQATIHEVVRDRYGSIARSLDTTAMQAASCCGEARVPVAARALSAGQAAAL